MKTRTGKRTAGELPAPASGFCAWAKQNRGKYMPQFATIRGGTRKMKNNSCDKQGNQ